MDQSNELMWILKKGKLSREVVSHVESELDISFPTDYVDCVMQNNGGQPVPDTFNFQERTGAVFNSLIHLNIGESRNIVDVYNNLKLRLPKKIYPFADDPFGNYLCFDYREGKAPVIVFWDHEKASIHEESSISFVSSSFNELLDNLYE
ncbi:hypothetical protein FHS16_005150 [Paenibacillus endophyticus]|uniref:Knr4/Smi1-like domain-containing protein n=1 Tax=Paenibacillus endophyticus TaxID=1294268 RepID=A0A7W5CC90_9BACL|nr:SMI1/KNR4 family protein [Paenibacillus endophyticus]MBB3155043.1 hypothetical protein [Paenibacillus endophyticus]